MLCKQRNCHILSCTNEKGIKYCIDCTEFPCKIMKRNIKRWMQNYKQDVVDNMKMIKKIGEKDYIKEMNGRIDKEKD